jgi:hypothetical protein
VLNKTKLDTLLKKKWEGITNSLSIKDTSKALIYISSATRASYQQMFDALKDQLPAIIATKREFNLIDVMGNAAKYELVTLENSKTYSYEVIFIKDKEGFWVIQDF